MTSRADELRRHLQDHEVSFEERPLDNGVQFRCAGGEIFNAFRTGRVQLQGKKTAFAQAIIARLDTATTEADVAPTPPRRVGGPDRRVFIVYGHDIPARDNLELVLRRMGLDPIVIGSLPAGGDTIIEKLEKYLGRQGEIGFACVLLTPDDEGHPVGKPEDQRYRARQNVVLELGMVLARLGRARVAILYKESVELPSDIGGLLYLPFKERVQETAGRLYTELEAAGYRPRSSGLS